MPILTAQTWIYKVLSGLPLPGNTGPLQVFVTPPNPEEDQLDPHCYVWPSTGTEARQSLPRAAGPWSPITESGWKQDMHAIDVFLIWFNDDSDPTPDFSFPAIVDAVMACLRTTQDPVAQADPETGQPSWIFGTGERMSYDIPPPRGTDQDQTILRYDARIVVKVGEEYQG